MLVGWFSKGAMDEVRNTVNALKKLIEGYRGPKEFEADWKWLRLMVPFQMRLLVEQVLWDKRGGWRDLVTGFGPVKGRSARSRFLESTFKGKVETPGAVRASTARQRER